MKCQICDYKLRPYGIGVVGESLSTLSWSLVDSKEYEMRKKTDLMIYGHMRFLKPTL